MAKTNWKTGDVPTAEDFNRIGREINACVYVIAQHTRTLSASGWGLSSAGRYEQTVELSEMTIDGRLRYALSPQAVGVALVAGVRCDENGTATVVCMTQPTAAFEMTFCIEGVRA